MAVSEGQVKRRNGNVVVWHNTQRADRQLRQSGLLEAEKAQVGAGQRITVQALQSTQVDPPVHWVMGGGQLRRALERRSSN